MRFSRWLVTCLGACGAVIASFCTTPFAMAVVAPSTFSSTIQVQGEVEGTEFDDWSEIPIALSDPEDALFGTDVKDIQIANNDEFLFIHVTLHNTSDIDLNNLFLAFDTDQDAATGFNVNGQSLMGSEVGFQADYPFQQDIEVFNTGVEGVTEFGGSFIGLGLIFPFINFPDPFVGTQLEWAIPLDVAIGPDAPGTPVFTSDTFDLNVYYSGLFLDETDDIITYTLAENPNPGTAGDFDGDEDVDGADFLEWQREFGTLDADDLADWQTNYGPGPGTLAGVSAVPEPTGLMLSGLGIALLAFHRGQK